MSSRSSAHPAPRMSLTTAEVEALLAQLRDDPKGWASLDLHKLLDHFNFSQRRYDEVKGLPPTRRYHDRYRDLDVLLFPVEEVSPTVARRVLFVIEELVRREG